MEFKVSKLLDPGKVLNNGKDRQKVRQVTSVDQILDRTPQPEEDKVILTGKEKSAGDIAVQFEDLLNGYLRKKKSKDLLMFLTESDERLSLEGKLKIFKSFNEEKRVQKITQIIQQLSQNDLLNFLSHSKEHALLVIDSGVSVLGNKIARRFPKHQSYTKEQLFDLRYYLYFVLKQDEPSKNRHSITRKGYIINSLSLFEILFKMPWLKGSNFNAIISTLRQAFILPDVLVRKNVAYWRKISWGAKNIYKLYSKEIQLKNTQQNDWPVLIHEIGHSFYYKELEDNPNLTGKIVDFISEKEWLVGVLGKSDLASFKKNGYSEWLKHPLWMTSENSDKDPKNKVDYHLKNDVKKMILDYLIGQSNGSEVKKKVKELVALATLFLDKERSPLFHQLVLSLATIYDLRSLYGTEESDEIIQILINNPIDDKIFLTFKIIDTNKNSRLKLAVINLSDFRKSALSNYSLKNDLEWYAELFAHYFKPLYDNFDKLDIEQFDHNKKHKFIGEKSEDKELVESLFGHVFKD